MYLLMASNRGDFVIIAIDAMGGDYAPDEIVKGTLNTSKHYDGHLLLVGDKVRIEKIMGRCPKNIEVIDAKDVITNDDSPVSSIKKKKDSSMYKGLTLLKNRQCDAFISSGNTGALMAGSLMLVGRSDGVKRPALAPLIPTKYGSMLLIDAGSNTDTNEYNLMQFARMGSIYLKHALNIEDPRVGLFNIGAEQGKGNEVVKKTFLMLKSSDLNFVGNVEGRDIFLGKADVLVCDGFVGNAILKTIEGTAFTLMDMLKTELTRNALTKLAAYFLKGGFKNISKKLDYKYYGASPLLGINGACLKAHGSSDAKAIENAIIQAHKYVESNVVDYISKEMRMGVNTNA